MNDKNSNESSHSVKFKKATRAQKKGAKEVLRLGQKVFDYRKDLLSAEDLNKLFSANADLKSALQQKPVNGDLLELKAKEVDQELQKNGGQYYHKKTWVENVEMLLVAAIVVIGIRSFFVQPFIIPTNSMYPSFSGMQPFVYNEEDETPGFLGRCFDKVLLGATHFKINAENSFGNLKNLMQKFSICIFVLMALAVVMKFLRICMFFICQLVRRFLWQQKS